MKAQWREDPDAPVDLEAYPDREAFYDANPEARGSGESDYGVWWRDDDRGTWRISWVHATGDVYAVRAPRPAPRDTTYAGWLQLAGLYGARMPVVVLGNVGKLRSTGPDAFDHTEPLEAILPGWGERCGELGSLAWAVRRIRNASYTTKPEPEEG